MTFGQFRNALNHLYNIQYDVFRDAMQKVCAPEWSEFDYSEVWVGFFRDPYGWFIRAPDFQAQAIFEVIKQRIKED